MGNFTSCKIYIKRLTGVFDLEDLKSAMSKLQKSTNINQNIDVYYSTQQDEIEIRFGAKWYPVMIEDLFPLSENEIWNITSDEGGCMDQITRYSSNSEDDKEISENATYKFDQIRIEGDIPLINLNLSSIFGEGIISASRKVDTESVEIYIGCTYTSNNYFLNENKNCINLIERSKIPVEGIFGVETEMWNMSWELEGIDFKNRFYKEVLNKPEGLTKFPFVKKIKFYLGDKVTNIIEWNENGLWSNWDHKAINSYENCVNQNLLMYREKNT